MLSSKQSKNSRRARKLFISLFSIFVLATVFSNIALAQSVNSSSEGIIIATVNISNAKIVSSEGRNYKLSFDISNRIGAQSQIRYSVRLTENDLTVDEKVYDESFSLAENASINKVIDYTITPSLPIGTYKLWIDSKNSSGLSLSIALVGEVKITENIPDTIEIVPESCNLIKDESLLLGAKREPYPLNKSISIEPKSIFSVKCKVRSNLFTDITLTPSFTTRSHTSFGDIVMAVGGTTESFTIKNGINNITFILPKALEPQNYNLSFSLISADKKTISNSISFNYSITGQTGTIQNVIFDKTYYKAGDTANLQIYSTQTSLSTQAGINTITATILDEKGNCSIPLIKEVSNFSVTDIYIPITKDCANPKADITLSSNNTILDSKNYQVTTVLSTSTPMTISTKTTLTIIVIILIALLLAVLFYAKKYSVLTFILVGIIFSGSFYFSNIDKAEAQGGCWGSCASLCTAWYTFNPTCLHCSCPAIPPPATISAFTAPTPISYNSSVTISWTSSYSGSCTLGVTESGGGINSGSFAYPGSNSSGSRTDSRTLLNLKSDTSLSLVCTGINWGANSSTLYRTIQVIQPMIINLNAGSTYITSGSSTAITWNSSGVNSCNITNSNNSSWDIIGTLGGYTTFGSYGKPYFTQLIDPPYTISGNSYFGQFNYPRGIALDSSGNIYVADTANHRVQKFSPSGTFILAFGSPYGGASSAQGEFNSPYGVAVDSSDNIYVTDYYNNRVQKFNSYGVFSSVIVSSGLYYPNGIALDSSGNIYVSDNYNRIQKFDSSGNFVWWLGFNGSTVGTHTTSGTGTIGSGNGQFWNPSGIFIDTSNNIYVADYQNSRIQKFDSSGNFVWWLGYGSYVNGLGQTIYYTGAHTSGTAVGGNVAGRFSGPSGISLDSLGNIYVTDIGNRIQKFDSSGNYVWWMGFDGSTIGTHTTGGGVSGSGLGQFYYPLGIDINSSDDIYVIEQYNHRVQKYTNPKSNLLGSKSSGNITATTTFTATCVNGFSQSTTTSKTVGVRPATTTPPTNVTAVSATTTNCGEIAINWTSSAPNHILYKDDVQIASGDSATLSLPYIDLPGDGIVHTYYVIAFDIFTGYSASSTVVSASATPCVIPTIPIIDVPITSDCAPSQGTSTLMYVNRNTTWTVNLSTSTSNLRNIFTDWSGTNIPGTLNIPGLTFDKIYTTVGLKNITAHTTGEYLSSGNTFFADCSTSTLMKLDPGTGGEL
jgi:hypothetical protein